MRNWLARMGLVCLAFSSSAMAGEAAPGAETAGGATFARKPTAVKDGDKIKIEFAVDRPTDVAVYVEDAKGQIVRHLVAGVLGRNAPAPLKANSLEQSVEWEGRDDDGRPAAGGPFKVRVGLGLTTRYAGQPFAETNQAGPNGIENVMGLAAGPDGRLYVLVRGAVWSDHWRLSKLHVFRHDGSYEKTIKPFPSNTPVERATGAFTNSFGSFNPLIHRVHGLSFYSHEDTPHQPAVADGRIVLAAVPGVGSHGGAAHLAVLDSDGGIPNSTYAGPALGAGLGYAAYPVLVAGSDSKTIYLTGLGPGNDNAHLNDPRGLAVDGKGHLLVADFGNNRVLVLNEKGKGVVGSLAAAAPSWVAVHLRTGAVYVCSKRTTVIKLSGWENAKEQSRVDVVGWFPGKMPAGQEPHFALEGSAESAVLWVASGSKLLRCEDRGTKFSDPVPADCFAAGRVWRPAADPTRREVISMVDRGRDYGLKVLDEQTGQIRSFSGDLYGRGICNHVGYRLGPDGAIYGINSSTNNAAIIRYDREGKPSPFQATANDPMFKGGLPVGTSGTTYWERDFSVDRRGDIYVKRRGPIYHGLMAVDVFDRDGRFKRTALHTVSDGAYGPRVDPKGNLYIMEAIKPAGQPFPAEFKDRIKGLQYVNMGYDWIYSSVIKFAPEGGAVWFSGDLLSPLLYEGWGSDGTVSDLRTTGGSLTGTLARKPPVLSFPWAATVDSAVHTKITVRMKNDTDGTQAVLRYHNVGEGYAAYCGPGNAKALAIKPNGNFTEYIFDMAGEKDWRGSLYGLRLILPNASKGSFSIDWVRVGDAGSKLIWNFDAEDGPDKRRPTTMKKEQVAAYRPVTKSLRPRKADDPKDLVSPFARPDIAFAWIIGLAVSDRYAYVGDVINKRILRVRLDYAAEESCEVK